MSGEKSLADLRGESHVVIPVLFIVIILTAVVPIALWSAAPEQYKDALLTFSLIGTPLVTFFGFIWLGEYLKKIEPTLGVIRTALTASVVSAYFVLLALTIFIADQETQLPLQQQLVNNFTTVVGVVIAFYFGSAAYNQGKGGR